jgi:hypothetical protein
MACILKWHKFDAIGTVMKKTILAISCIGFLVAPTTAQPVANCGLVGKVTHNSFDGPRQIHGGQNGLFFTSGLAVNTDGSSISYHPDDPSGTAGLAINTICNGANAILTNGTKLDYTRCKELKTAYNQAKASGWAKVGVPRMAFYAVATKHEKPCLVTDGPHKGYFVSTTSLLADASRDVCDPARYLDSLEIPFSIYPKNSALTRYGVGVGTVTISYNPVTKVIEYGLVGDRGPARGLAEGSVFLARTLAAKQTVPRTRQETYAFVVPNVHTLMLPSAKVKPPYTLDNIRSQAKAAFDAWGGRARFDTCVGTIGRQM